MTLDTSCPSLELLRRSLDPDDPMSDGERQRIEVHVDGCQRGCKQTIAALLDGNTLLPIPGQTPPPVNRPDALPSTTLEEPLPPRMGRYQITGRLGAGGMGVVLRGHDPQLGRDVAVKVPTFHGSDEARSEARQRFVREAHAAAAVRHTNICPIYDIGEQDGRPFVVMALVEGESLAERLRRQGRFEESRAAVQLILKVADALASVHAARLVHRDLKPGNILLDRAGEPFLADFGLAHREEGERLTAVGQLLGTPAYMAPEQAALELGPVGPWSDQYSLGVVLYEMLAGRPPFEGSAAALVFQIGTKPVPPLSERRPDLDVRLERLLLKALARQARERFASVADFAAALRSWCAASPVLPAGRPSDGQRRRITVLQVGCDLFEAEALLAALDPEEQQVWLEEFQHLCRSLVAELEGTVVKPTNDGLLACFGFPLALESPSRRACRASLQLLERMAGLNQRLDQQHRGLHLSVRIAVHCDLAVATETGGALSIVGQVLPVVEQLEHLAVPDSVIISDHVHQMIEGYFECSSLGPQKLGAGGAKPVYRVHRQLAARSRVDIAGPTGLTPLIGREREVAMLQGCWDQTVEGRGQVVLLVGEAGIGKSRLVRVLREHVLAPRTGGIQATVIEWPCAPHTQYCSLFHARESMERLMGLGQHDAPVEKLNKLAVHLGELDLASAENVFLLASLLSIPGDGRYPNPGWSPVRQKEKTLDLLLDWLRALARRQPVLFVVEDLHWAGSITLEFLGLLAGQLRDDRVMTLLTYRPEFQLPWRGRGLHTQVSLSPLTRRQTSELLHARIGLSEIPPDIVETVADRTDGVPLFVEEFAAMLQAGCVYVVGASPQLSDFFEGHSIPATLQDLLLARLERAAGRFEIVQLAATIGREFSHELLQAVAAVEEEILQQELARLVQAELLFVRGRPPHTRYQFKHALIQDAAYQSLLKKKRQQFHGRIAEALEQRFPETCAAQPELLAHHFTEGNVVPRAVEYWARAGERAQQRGAAAEAVSNFQRGLALVRTLPESRERHGEEIRLSIGLGVALAAIKGTGAAEVEATFARAHALCLQTGLTAEKGPVLFGRLRFCMNRAMHAQAQELAEELRRLAEQEGNTGFMICAHCALGVTLVSMARHTEAVAHLEKVIAVEAARELRVAVHRYCLIDPWVTAHSFLSWSLWLLGFAERASEHSRQAVSTSERLNHAFSLGFALSNASWLHHFARDHEAARATAARALAVGTDKGFAGIIAPSRILCGWTPADSRQNEQTLTAIRQGLEELHTQGAVADRHDLLMLLAEVCAHAGRPEEGLKALVEAQEFADVTGGSIWEPEIHRLRGELLLQHDPAAVVAAAACFQQALAVARRQHARLLELRAAMSLGRLWSQHGQTQAARELVGAVYGTFTEGFQTHDLQMAAAFLEHQRRSPAAP